MNKNTNVMLLFLAPPCLVNIYTFLCFKLKSTVKTVEFPLGPLLTFSLDVFSICFFGF